MSESNLPEVRLLKDYQSEKAGTLIEVDHYAVDILLTKKIIEVAKSDKKGHEKAEEVILYANEKYISKSYQWVTRLVVEILYVVAEEKGLLKRDVVKKSN